jgi:2-polyprenyl-3-methyl-5-hydroxy-6-metoxy-1,4-benzoquinol methylase
MSFTDAEQDIYTAEVVSRYCDFYGHGQDAFESLLVFSAADKLRRGGTLLDVGCGPGIIHDWLTLHPADYMGLDPSEPMIHEACRRHPGFRYAWTSFEEFDSKIQYDVVLGAFGPLMHVHDLEPFARKLGSVLAPDGKFILMGAGAPNQHVRMLDGASPPTVWHPPEVLQFYFGGSIYPLGSLLVVTNA